jgi:serine/threonine protein phosphatase 1
MSLFNRSPPKSKLPKGPQSRLEPGQLVYAIGDIHGSLELLVSLQQAILQDRRAFPECQATLVYLGDYIDRGSASRQVVDAILGFRPGNLNIVCLAGNHEEALVRFLVVGDLGPDWLTHGGEATLTSYGVSVPRKPSERNWEEIAHNLEAALPESHRRFFADLKTSFQIDDYFFCHAGIRPDIDLDDQTDRDLLWIRSDFLNDDRPLSKVIVHGHTPFEEVHSDHRRISIDTGAYATGLLSAVRLKDSSRSSIQVNRSGKVRVAELA